MSKSELDIDKRLDILEKTVVDMNKALAEFKKEFEDIDKPEEDELYDPLNGKGE